MHNLEYYTQIIQKVYPELEIVSAGIYDNGQYNRVIILNEVLVFRFAKVPEAVDTLRYEIAVQKYLQGRLPLQIPFPSYFNLETGIPEDTFVGYRMIPGKPLCRDDFNTIQDPASLKRMATQLARFLQELHRIDIKNPPINSLPRYETRDQWIGIYERIQQRLYPHMRTDARVTVTDHFEEYLNQTDEFGFLPRLRHGDFGSGNILYDPDNLSIIGIIDFGSVGIGDPAVDFAGLNICYREDFYEYCCTVYPDMRAGLNRVHFYCGTFALQEALFGIENGDEAAFNAGMVDYV